MLHWRLILGTILIAAFAGLCRLDHTAWLPGTWLMPLAVALAIFSAVELSQLMEAGGTPPRAWIVYCGNALIVLSNWVPAVLAKWNLWESSGDGRLSWQQSMALTAWPLAALTVCTLALFVNEMCLFQKPGRAITNMAASFFSLIYVGLLFSFLIQIRLAWGVGALVSLIIVVKLADTGAYLVGHLIGRHKMTPVLSPGKTIEGGVGAILFACLGAWLSYCFIFPAINVFSMPSEPCWCDKLLELTKGHNGNTACIQSWLCWAWIPYGILVGTAGILGDLAESLIKRDAGCKNSSDWMPGFGGVLDILDSLLFAAPAGWIFWIFISIWV
jgi:phosphatidate cytidylyltransferase